MGTIHRKFTGFSLGIVLGVCNAPNLNIPAIHQKVSVPTLLKWQTRFILMVYSMLVQPVINSQFVSRAYKMPVIASKSDTTVKAIGSDRNIELSAQSCNWFGTNTALGTDLIKRQAVFKIHLTKFFLSRINDLYAFTSGFPYARASNLMLLKPTHDRRAINTVHLTYLIITTMLFMDKAYKFFFSRFLDTTVKQSAASSTAGNIVELQPTKDFSLTYVELASNLTCRKALSLIEAVNSFIVRAAMVGRSKRTLWQSLDTVCLAPVAYGDVMYTKAVSNLLHRQSLGFIEIAKGFSIRARGKQGKLNRVIQCIHSYASPNQMRSLGIDRATNTVYAVSNFPHYTTSRANGLAFPVQIAQVSA